MTTAKIKRSKNDWFPVPNNPIDNETYIDKKEKEQEDKFNKEMMLYDTQAKEEEILEGLRKSRNEIYGGKYGYRQTASGRWRERDEPDFDIQLKQSDAIQKKLQVSKALAGKERLKQKGVIPIRKTTGAKLFETFLKEANKYRNQNIDDDNLRNIYNSARAIDDYEKWLWWIVNEYKSKAQGSI